MTVQTFIKRDTEPWWYMYFCLLFCFQSWIETIYNHIPNFIFLHIEFLHIQFSNIHWKTVGKGLHDRQDWCDWTKCRHQTISASNTSSDITKGGFAQVFTTWTSSSVVDVKSVDFFLKKLPILFSFLFMNNSFLNNSFWWHSNGRWSSISNIYCFTAKNTIGFLRLLLHLPNPRLKFFFRQPVFLKWCYWMIFLFLGHYSWTYLKYTSTQCCWTHN